MTKLEAEVMRAALRFWRAAKGFNADSPGKIVVHHDVVEKAKSALIEALDRAVPAMKDWVSVAQSSDPNVGVLRCAGCAIESTIQGPFTMERFAAVFQEFRGRHIDCGPIGEDPA